MLWQSEYHQHRFRFLSSRILITLLPQCTETYRYFGATPISVADGGVVVCGSMGEVSNDPSFTEVFDVSSNEFTVSSSDTLNNQKSVVWTEVALYGDDQLRQRMAWALAQIITTVPGEIPISHFPNSHFVTQHNLMHREMGSPLFFV